ncbi:MAG: hypothetical protein HY060_04420, partial [Proteobacteria bacterium]|nr:hypothetical protein [Pseudomonadota bacterium]
MTQQPLATLALVGALTLAGVALAQTIVPGTTATLLGTQTADQVKIIGGTIDGTAIGAGAPASGAFTSLTASGAVNFSGGALTLPAQAANTTLANATGSSAAPAAVATPLLYPKTTFRNLLDNGAFNLYQRGTTAVPSINTTATYHADRWAGFANNAGASVT